MWQWIFSLLHVVYQQCHCSIAIFNKYMVVVCTLKVLSLIQIVNKYSFIPKRKLSTSRAERELLNFFGFDMSTVIVSWIETIHLTIVNLHISSYIFISSTSWHKDTINSSNAAMRISIASTRNDHV